MSTKGTSGGEVTFPLEMIFEIVSYVELGLIDTLRNLRLVSKQFKAAVDKRVFKDVTLTRDGLRDVITLTTLNSFVNCRILNIRSIMSANFRINTLSYTLLPTALEIRSFAINQCGDNIPAVIGSEPLGHMFIGWHPQGDARMADFMDMIYSLSKPVWPRRIQAIGTKVVDMTLIGYSSTLSHTIQEAIYRAAESWKRNKWPIQAAADPMTPVRVRQSMVPTNFSVQIFRKIDCASARQDTFEEKKEMELGYWRDLIKEFRSLAIDLQVHHMSPFF